MTVTGEDFWIDELEFQLGRPLTPKGRDCLRTWLRAFAAHVTRQASPAIGKSPDESQATGSATESSVGVPEGAAPGAPESELDKLVAEYKHIADNEGEHRTSDLVWLVNELIYERDHGGK